MDTHKPPPLHVQPKRPHAPLPQWPLPPIQTFPSPPIPSGQVFPPSRYEPPPSRGLSPAPQSEVPAVPSPTPSAPSSASPAQPSGNGQQPQSPNTPTPNVATPQPNGPTPEPLGANPGGARGGVVSEVLPKTEPIPPSAALTLKAKTNRPVVGRDVIVVAALEPSKAGASYRLNWGDGSAVETVSDSGTHRYAKAKMYKVSASTVVGDSHLNREILLQVAPVMWPRFVGLMAVLAGLTFGAMHLFVPKLTASARWGAAGVPEMTLLNREPYMSLSFEPGARPAEEDITFSKK
jgi:hypothetical protein